MQRTQVDAWLVLCRENANDPLAMHVGGETAGAPAAFLFHLRGERVEVVALSPAGEAVSLRDTGLHDRVETLDRSASLYEKVARELRRADPKRLATWLRRGQGAARLDEGSRVGVGHVGHGSSGGLLGPRRRAVPVGRPVGPRPVWESAPQLAARAVAFDGFFSWKLMEGGTKTISVEEMAVVTDTSAEYLMPPQEELVLIR